MVRLPALILPATKGLPLLLSACVWLAGCASSGAAVAEGSNAEPWAGRGHECVRPFLGRDSPYGEAPVHVGEEPTLQSVPPEAARTMRASGLGPMVARALAAAAHDGPPTVDALVTRQDLGMRLISLETQLSAVIFEAECTGELIEAMTFQLEDRSDLRELRLALASLVVGALSATVAGLWDLAPGESNGPAVLGLGGGVASASLGAAAFVKRSRHMLFTHDRNLLRPAVEGSDSEELFPRFVFRLLVLPAPDGGPSPRDRLLVRWRELIEEAVEPGKRVAAEALLYGRGGLYSQDLMALRERLYDALETELNAQARDLELLDRFLVRALVTSGP